MIELGKAHSKPSDLALLALVVPDTSSITACGLHMARAGIGDST